MAIAQVVDLKKNILPDRPVSEKEVKEKNANIPQSLSWEAPEFDVYEKSAGWHTALFCLAAILIIAMAALKNYTAAAFFAVAALVIYLYGNKTPRLLAFGISSRGVQVGDRAYPYESLRSFWIFYEPHARRSELSLRSQKTLMPYIRVPLGSTNPAAVHRLLSQFLPERKHADSMANAVSRKAGF